MCHFIQNLISQNIGKNLSPSFWVETRLPVANHLRPGLLMTLDVVVAHLRSGSSSWCCLLQTSFYQTQAEINFSPCGWR